MKKHSRRTGFAILALVAAGRAASTRTAANIPLSAFGCRDANHASAQASKTSPLQPKKMNSGLELEGHNCLIVP
jgi:hypothetical protein